MSLLRSGAYAEHLEKQSFVGNAIRGGIGDLVVGAAKGALNLPFAVGKGAVKNWKPLLGLGIVGGGAASILHSANRQARQGLDDRAFQLRQQGLMDYGAPKAPK